MVNKPQNFHIIYFWSPCTSATSEPSLGVTKGLHKVKGSGGSSFLKRFFYISVGMIKTQIKRITLGFWEKNQIHYRTFIQKFVDKK